MLPNIDKAAYLQLISFHVATILDVGFCPTHFSEINFVLALCMSRPKLQIFFSVIGATSL
jgi:hypothetical protein